MQLKQKCSKRAVKAQQKRSKRVAAALLLLFSCHFAALQQNLRRRLQLSGGKVCEGVFTFELHCSGVVDDGGFLRRVECSEPNSFPTVRISDLRRPLSPRPSPNSAESLRVTALRTPLRRRGTSKARSDLESYFVDVPLDTPSGEGGGSTEPGGGSAELRRWCGRTPTVVLQTPAVVQQNSDGGPALILGRSWIVQDDMNKDVNSVYENNLCPSSLEAFEGSTSTLCRVLYPHRGVVKKDIGSLPEKEEWISSLPEKEDIGSLPEKEEWIGSLPEKEDIGSLPEKEEWSGSLPEKEDIGSLPEKEEYSGSLPEVGRLCKGFSTLLWEQKERHYSGVVQCLEWETPGSGRRSCWTEQL
ncbi:hypothetical protein M5K25_007187 [Dendrobium thyrsiflorum]|uniref:Uncharacterized protein n=1 Tax=Dendrobium thyrsiflorum TaxID=117978 RepID=A0ABD0VDT9_DENTH